MIGSATSKSYRQSPRREVGIVPWPFGRRSRPAVTVKLDPIRIILADADLSGSMRPTAERMTDILQRGTALSFLPAGSDPSEWVEFTPEQILLIVPPLHSSPRRMRAERHQQEVFIRIGEYAVTGTAHLRRGQGQDLYLRATHPFLPLTDATFARADQADPERVETLIVNLKWVEEFGER